MFRIDFDKNIVIVYDKDLAKTFNYTFDEFIDLLIDDKTELLNWIDNQRNNLNHDVSLLCKFKTVYSNDDELNIKLIYKDYNNNILYLIGTLFDGETKQGIIASKNKTIASLDDLRSYVGLNLNNKPYSLIAVNAKETYDLLLNRYGIEIADLFIKRLAIRIEKYFKHKFNIYKYDDGILLILNEKIKSKILLINILKGLYQRLKKPLLVDVYQFDVKISIGVSRSKDFSTEPTALSNEAYQASLYAHDKMFRLFDRSLIEGLRTSNIYLIEYKKAKESLNDNINFYPLYSLSSNNICADVANIKAYSKNINNIDKLYFTAKKFNDINGLHEQVISLMLSKHKSSPLPIMMFGGIDMFKTLIYRYGLKNQLDNTKIIFVFMDYKDILDNTDRYNDLITKAKNYHIEFGIIAHNLMTTTLTKLLRLFKYMVIPNHLSSNISNNEQNKNELENILYFTNRYNYKLVAKDIDNYKDAAILKTLGVLFMEGSLFDERETTDYTSVRQISKLMDKEEGE